MKIKMTRNAEEISARIAEVEKRIVIIDQQISKELRLAFFNRRPKVCLFLDAEKRKYAGILKTLKWMIHE